jgi:ATP-dependent DNA ligase
VSALAYLFRPHAAASAYPSCWFHPALPADDSPLLHEIKHDGFRVVARKDGAPFKLYSRPGFSPVLEETGRGQRLAPLAPDATDPELT